MLPKHFLLSLLAFSAGTYAAALTPLKPVTYTHNTRVKCDTTSGSPESKHVTAAINYIKGKGKGGDCNLGYQFGDECRTFARDHTAKVDHCSYYDVMDIDCLMMADWLVQVQNECTRTIDGVERVGGRYIYPDTIKGGPHRVQITYNR